MEEQWKQIKSASRKTEFFISNIGRIKSVYKKQNGPPRVTIKKPTCQIRYGKPSYLKSSAGKEKTFFIHREVALAFVPNSENKPHVNHIDGNLQNNYFTNLEWVTPQENNDHAVREGLAKRGRNPHPWRKGPLKKAKERNVKRVQIALLNNDGSVKQKWQSLKEASFETGVKIPALSLMASGKQKTTKDGRVFVAI